MILGGKYFKLNLIPNHWGRPTVIRINQFDEEFTELGFEVYNGDEVLAMDGITSATILGKKPDGTEFEYECTIDSENNKVSVPVKDQMSILSGDVKAELALSNGDGGVVHTWNFTLRVEPAIATGANISDVDIADTISNAAKITAIMSAIAPTYDSTQTYAENAVVWHENQLYKCTAAVETAEEFDSAKWATTTLASLLLLYALLP